ncbi:MAG: PKD domain-containing protein, partial [Janthinobacterium lividum]
ASGNLVYYLDQSGTSRSITSPKTYNDGAWHHVVATLSSSGMVLYADGAKAASWTSITSGRAYGGFWRIGADVLPGKTSTTSSFLSGTIDDVAVYPTALSASTVKTHYTSSGRTAAAAPTAAFTMACDSLVCSYDASPSTPDVSNAETAAAKSAAVSGAAADPTIAGYSWNFGDGDAATDVKTTHAYRAAGTFDVTLAVTNSDGAVSTSTQTVDAVGNAVPVASFTSKAKGKKLSFDATRSADSDGRIKKYKWDFGDGSTSTKSKTSHTYKGTGSYLVKLAVTDDDGATGSTSTTLLTGGSSLASDDFQRTGDGWGTAKKGGTWTTDADAGFATDGDRGGLTLDTAGEGGTATLAKVSTTKANVVGDVSIDKVGSNAGTTAAYVLRQRAGADYRAKLVFVEDGKLFLVVSRVVDDKEKVIKTVKVKTTYQPGDVLRLRATISSAKNASIKATVWHAGTKEPSAQLSTKDSTRALNKAGSVGIWGYQAQSATNAPVQLDFDNLLVTAS